MEIFRTLKDMLRDKTRDKVCTCLCAIGVDARIAERRLPEEKLGCIGLKRSLGLVEIHGEPIQWVNVINWTQHFPGNVQKYRNVYLVHDLYLSTKSKLNGNEIGRRIKKDVLLNQGLIGLDRDIEILAFPEDKCWAILSKDYEGRNPPPSLEQWNSFKTIALTFAGAGADVAVCARHLPALEKVAEEIRALGRRASAIQANIRTKKDVNNMVLMTTKEFGGIDILVNNACETKNPHKILVDLPEEEWDIVMDTDLKGYYLCSQTVGRLMMKKKEGNIINTSSISAVIPETPLGAYSIAKAGVAMMTKMLAVELAPYNIRVNAVGPGFVRTGMTDHYWTELEGLEKLKPWIDRTPLKHLAESSDVAAAALFLASDASRSITGHTIFVDGGWLIA